MKQLLSCTLVLLTLSVSAQKEIFRSEQKFTETQLETFYSSLVVYDSMVYFKANDYTLYAYNKHTGKQAWKYYMKYKSNTKMYQAANYLWSNVGESEGLRLNMDGSQPKTLVFSIYSEPYIKNNMLYTTGIYEAGNVLAYDINADSVAWYRFVAHGCDVKPYYLQDKILANAEGQNWIELDYSGKMNKDCEAESDAFPEGKDCIKEFIFRTHDSKLVTLKDIEKLGLEEYGTREIVTTDRNTIILEDGRLVVLGNKMKKHFSGLLYELSEDIEENSSAYTKIIRVDERTIWISYDEKLISFDIKNKSIKQIIELESWNPHQIVMDGNTIWLINSKDGLLYALSLNLD